MAQPTRDEVMRIIAQTLSSYGDSPTYQDPFVCIQFSYADFVLGIEAVAEKLLQIL